MPAEPAAESLLRFPCAFPIKALGVAGADFDALVVGLIRPFAPDLGEGAVQTRLSANGRYMSVTVTVQAQSRGQLDSIYTALTGHQRVLMAF
jgi:hypothetical protein